MTTTIEQLVEGVVAGKSLAIGRAISIAEAMDRRSLELLEALDKVQAPRSMTLGITGTGGAGKSTLVCRLVDAFRGRGRRVGVIAVDPSSPVSGGAVLGDRVRMMRHACDSDVVIRSMASRGRLGGLSSATSAAAKVMMASGCDPVIVETVGVGQAEFDVVRLADVTALVMAPGLGDDIQAMKAGLAELADLMVVNKGDLPGADALIRHLEPVAQDRGAQVLKVSALNGDGVEGMVQVLLDTFQHLSSTGLLASRRKAAAGEEALRLAAQMARERLAVLVRRQLERGESDATASPLAMALAAVEELAGKRTEPSPTLPAFDGSKSG